MHLKYKFLFESALNCDMNFDMNDAMYSFQPVIVQNHPLKNLREMLHLGCLVDCGIVQ